MPSSDVPALIVVEFRVKFFCDPHKKSPFGIVCRDSRKLYQRGERMARKVYVEVTARFDTDGRITPLSLTWEDGTVFEIGRVLDCRRAASLKAGGIGMRYTVRIGNQQSYLYYADPRWFVEAKAT